MLDLQRDVESCGFSIVPDLLNAEEIGALLYAIASVGLGQIKGAMTAAKLAHFLSVNLKVPVEDLTGLTETLFTAVRKALGLRLEKRKLSEDLIVIDHMERTPSAN
jgi:hypothetical protein